MAAKGSSHGRAALGAAVNSSDVCLLKTHHFAGKQDWAQAVPKRPCTGRSTPAKIAGRLLHHFRLFRFQTIFHALLDPASASGRLDDALKHPLL